MMIPNEFEKQCNECGHFFDVEVVDENFLNIDGFSVQIESDGSGWELSTIHGPNECDSLLIIHADDDEITGGDGAPCCPDPQCGGNPCTFPGYADNH